jgi:hypothetical protein
MQEIPLKEKLMLEQPSLQGLTTDFTDLILPWISVLISLVVAIWFKDFATSFAKGIAFSMSKAFNEGDKVVLDGVDAIIVKIGVKNTVFGIYGDRGYTWRYVPNERIAMLKLEKVVAKDVHRDTPLEEAKRIQAILDAGQDKAISTNKEEIEKLKNGI